MHDDSGAFLFFTQLFFHKLRIVAFLDFRLVDYNGLKLLQDIRNHHHDLPVILCTAYDTYKCDPKAMVADYYVIKSFNLSELKMAATRAVEGRAPMQLAAG